MPHLNKNVVGYVPAKMTFVQREPSEVSDYWEHDFWGDEKPPTRTVRETFVVDADNPNTRKTATEWAGPHAVFTDKPNDPIEEVEVVSLVLRGNGGRAWKVLIDGTFYVDLREDVMLDALRHGAGVKKGMLKGPFVWCGVGTQMKLVRVGSKLHEVVLAAGKRKAAKDVKKFEVGGVYENRKGERSVYLGQVDTEYVIDTNYEENRKRSYHQNALPVCYRVTEERNVQLWCDIPTYRKSFKEVMTKERDPYGPGWCYWCFKTAKGRTMAGKVGEVDVSGVFDKIRRIGKDCVEYAVADTTKNIQERRTYGDLNECVLGHMAHHMRLCLMRPTGEPRPDAPSIQKLLDLVKEQLT